MIMRKKTSKFRIVDCTIKIYIYEENKVCDKELWESMGSEAQEDSASSLVAKVHLLLH